MSSSITAKRTETKFTCIISILNAENVPAGIEFCVEVIGFETDWEWGGPPGVGSVSRGDSRNMPPSTGWNLDLDRSRGRR